VVLYAGANAVVTALGFTVGEWVAIAGVAFGAIAYGIRETLDLVGRSPSSKRLREENVDLIRRNEELTGTVERLEVRVDELRGEVDELRKTNQAAVLRAIEQHERSAGERHERTVAIMERIAESLEAGR
jgi:predicted RNase H-like nuclease (RuvC/YqgF family)